MWITVQPLTPSSLSLSLPPSKAALASHLLVPIKIKTFALVNIFHLICFSLIAVLLLPWHILQGLLRIGTSFCFRRQGLHLSFFTPLQSTF